jgi:hypothetical protein
LVEHLLPVKGWLELMMEIARRPKFKPDRLEPSGVPATAS